ncbi:hypothetical protein JZ751_022351 [Albula glossodonta]|uniref:Uncharacterized protein n=1 Tax=Albula glossodonta TaxID=121402 RepID=A0A8T2NQL0_9TELE|nr:hypothetical protein JZ751_022351 [Albula glossodonta]
MRPTLRQAFSEEVGAGRPPQLSHILYRFRAACVRFGGIPQPLHIQLKRKGTLRQSHSQLFAAACWRSSANQVVAGRVNRILKCVRLHKCAKRISREDMSRCLMSGKETDSPLLRWSQVGAGSPPHPGSWSQAAVNPAHPLQTTAR